MAAVAPAIADCSPLRWPSARRRRAFALPPWLEARARSAASVSPVRFILATAPKIASPGSNKRLHLRAICTNNHLAQYARACGRVSVGGDLGQEAS